ncbi:leucine-rich repeat-containing protein 37A-like, partial [Tupaia chinensis]|uniref:leucine-rich repeat-containing protein 37A-like n=1 Tax=Tupaia chinensis TaxID=246437 RepID=UPI000FFC98FB
MAQAPYRPGPLCPKASLVMSRLCLWTWYFLALQPLWLLIQGGQSSDWAQVPDQVMSVSQGPTESWSFHPSHHPPKSPYILKPPADPGGIDYLKPSAPSLMSAPPGLPQELGETLAPIMDTDSPQELPPGPDRFAVPHQEVRDKFTRHERLPEVVPIIDWGQNQHQDADHQWLKIPVPSLDSQSTKTAKFVSSSNLKKYFTQYRRFAKVMAGSPDQFVSVPQHRRPTLLQVDSFEPPESPEQVETSQFHLETKTQNSEEEQISSPQKEAPAPSPQPLLMISREAGKRVESTPNQEQAPAQPAEDPEGVEAAIQQEAPAQFPDIPLEAEPLSVQEQLAEAPEEAETSVLQQASSQSPQNNKPTVIPPGHSQDHHSVLTNVLKPADLELTVIQPAGVVGTSPIHHEDASQPLVPANNGELFGTQHEVPTLAPEPLETLEPFPVAQEVVTQSPEPARDEKPYPAQQEATAQQSQAPEEIEASLIETSLLEQEAPIQLSQTTEVESFLSHQEAPVQPPAFPMEYTDYPLLSDEITILPLPPRTTQDPMVPNTNVALGLVTPEPTTEVEYSPVQQEDIIQPLIATGHIGFPPIQSNPLSQPPETHIKFESFLAHHEAIAQTPDTFKKVEPSPEQLAEPSLAFQEAPPQLLKPPHEAKSSSLKQTSPVQSPESLMMVEPSLDQQRAASLQPQLLEVMEPRPTQQEVTASPPQPLNRVESALVKQTAPTQLSEPRKVVAAESSASYEMTVPTSGHQTQSPTLPSVGFQPLDLMLTITQEPTVRVEHSTTLKTTTRHPNLVQTQYPNLNEITVQPADVEITITSQPTEEYDLPPTMQET